MMNLKTIALAVLVSIAGSTTALANHTAECSTETIERIWELVQSGGAPLPGLTRVDYGTEEKDRILSAARSQGASPGVAEDMAAGVVVITADTAEFYWLFFIDEGGCVTQDVKVSRDFWRSLIRIADITYD